MQKIIWKRYHKDSDNGCILEVDDEYSKDLHDLHIGLPFLPERMKINKCNKLLCNLYDKKNNVANIRFLKQALNLRLILKST